MLLSKTKTDVLIDETIDEIRTHSGFLRLYTDDTIVADIPLYQLRSVLILGSKINIPARLIKLCAVEKIPLHILTNQKKFFGSLHFGVDKTILNRKLQYQVTLDSHWQLYLAKNLLFQKFLTQQATLIYFKDPLFKKFSHHTDLLNEASTTTILTGIEGRAATQYWKGFGTQIVQTGFDWPGRKKNPTLDPVNSLLSLSYGLLATQCQTSLSIHGLDPYLGLLHVTNPDRPALTYDLMEIYRSWVVDLWVLQLFISKTFTKEDFVFTKEGVCTLEPLKKNQFFKLWYKRLKYHKLSTNVGEITIHEFFDYNTELLLKWFQALDNHKQRDRGLYDKMAKNLIIFKDLTQLTKI